MKQGTIFGPIMCCATTSRVNTIQDSVKYQYGNGEIGMPKPVNLKKLKSGDIYFLIEKIWRSCQKQGENRNHEKYD